MLGVNGFEWVRLLAAFLYAACFLIVLFLIVIYRNSDVVWQRSARYALVSYLLLVVLVGVRLLERAEEHVPLNVFTWLSLVAAACLIRGHAGLIKRSLSKRREGTWLDR